MTGRNFLFFHEIAGALNVPSQTAARLHRYGYLRKARKALSGSNCDFVYDAARIASLRTALNEGGELAGTIAYLETIEREE